MIEKLRGSASFTIKLQLLKCNAKVKYGGYQAVLRGSSSGSDAGDVDDGERPRHARTCRAGRGLTQSALPHRLRYIRAY